MTALLTDTPRPGDVDVPGSGVCPADWTRDETGTLMRCHRPLVHDGDHWDDYDKTSWRIEEQPHA